MGTYCDIPRADVFHTRRFVGEEPIGGATNNPAVQVVWQSRDVPRGALRQRRAGQWQ